MKPANLAPAYCSLYPMLCEVARENGYSLAIHGTLGRDMDLLAVAWTEGAAEPLALVTAIAEILDGQMGLCARSNGDGTFTETSSWEPSKKPHGRLAWSIKLRDFAWNGTNPFIDLSVIPPSTTTPAPDAAITEEWLREIGGCDECGSLTFGDDNGVRQVSVYRGKVYVDKRSLDDCGVMSCNAFLSLLDALGVPTKKDKEVPNG